MILMYHGLDAANGGFNGESFNNQIQYLADNDYNTITFEHLASWIETGSPELPNKPIILTFDDNYLSIYTRAFPELKKHGFIGYNFTHTNYVGVVTSFDHADWDEIREMEVDGTIITESHTLSHADLADVDAQQLSNEVIDSKIRLMNEIPGKAADHFSYPYGSYNPAVLDMVEMAGYKTAVTTVQEPVTRNSELLELPRFAVNPNASGDTAEVSNAFINTVNSFISVSGNWTFSTSSLGYEGTGYHFAPAGDGDSIATWTFQVPETGIYTIDINWTSHPNRATNAPYSITDKIGTSVFLVDQTQNGGVWNEAGLFEFEANTDYTVRLSNDANGYVIADAIRVERTSSGESWMIY